MRVKEPPIIMVRREGGKLTFDPNGANRAIIAAGNKLYLWVDNDLWEAITELPKAYFPEIAEKITMKADKLPPALLRQAQLFFRAVDKEHSSESTILYFLNTVTKERRPYIPPQEVTGTSVDYKIEPEVMDKLKEEGFLLDGSIHSHPNFGAFQSHTDTKDEISFEGWHITLGNVEKEIPEIHCRVVINGVSKDVEKEFLIDLIPNAEFPEEWLKQVRKKTYLGFAPGITVTGSSKSGYKGHRKTQVPRLKNRGDWHENGWGDTSGYYGDRYNVLPHDSGPELVWKEDVVIYFYTGNNMVMENVCTTEFI